MASLAIHRNAELPAASYPDIFEPPAATISAAAVQYLFILSV
jgi:hypothetical protein